MSSEDPQVEVVTIARPTYERLIRDAESALNIIDRARVRLRPQPSTMRVSDRPLIELARAELDLAYDLLQKALLPW